MECGEVLPAKSLRQHLESRHWVNVKNKLCPTCGKAFRTKAEIEIHLAVVHEENLQSVICHVCGKELQHPKMLARVSFGLKMMTGLEPPQFLYRYVKKVKE